jgi:hypothetical protein
MTEDRRKKKREYARRWYKEYCEGLRKVLFKGLGITSEMGREEILKRVCKNHLISVFDCGKFIGKELARRKGKERAKFLEKRFKGQFLQGLTRDLKRAGILPFPNQKITKEMVDDWIIKNRKKILTSR